MLILIDLTNWWHYVINCAEQIYFSSIILSINNFLADQVLTLHFHARYIEQQCHWVRSITVDLDWFLSHNAHFSEYQWQQPLMMPEARYSKLYEWLCVLSDINSSAILLALLSTFVCLTNMSWIFCSRMLCQIPANDAMLLLHSKRGWSQNDVG